MSIEERVRVRVRNTENGLRSNQNASQYLNAWLLQLSASIVVDCTVNVWTMNIQNICQKLDSICLSGKHNRNVDLVRHMKCSSKDWADPLFCVVALLLILPIFDFSILKNNDLLNSGWSRYHCWVGAWHGYALLFLSPGTRGGPCWFLFISFGSRGPAIVFLRLKAGQPHCHCKWDGVEAGGCQGAYVNVVGKKTRRDSRKRKGTFKQATMPSTYYFQMHARNSRGGNSVAHRKYGVRSTCESEYKLHLILPVRTSRRKEQRRKQERWEERGCRSSGTLVHLKMS